jgi:hypothetical protein
MVRVWEDCMTFLWDDGEIWYLNRDVNQPLWGNNRTLRVEPMALGGRLVAKRAITAPVLPWLVLMRPHMVFIDLKIL